MGKMRSGTTALTVGWDNKLEGCQHGKDAVGDDRPPGWLA